MKNSASNQKGAMHDGQRNYDHSNQRNPDHIRNATRNHHYRDHDEELTNDANYDPDTQEPKVEMDFDDKDQNQDPNPS